MSRPSPPAAPMTEERLDPARELRARIIGMVDGRIARGVETHGAPIDPHDSHDWLTELDEELVDALVYSMAARMKISKLSWDQLKLIGEQANRIDSLEAEVERLRSEAARAKAEEIELGPDAVNCPHCDGVGECPTCSECVCSTCGGEGQIEPPDAVVEEPK